jgi:hypothetical protein
MTRTMSSTAPVNVKCTLDNLSLDELRVERRRALDRARNAWTNEAQTSAEVDAAACLAAIDKLKSLEAEYKKQLQAEAAYTQLRSKEIADRAKAATRKRRHKGPKPKGVADLSQPLPTERGSYQECILPPRRPDGSPGKSEIVAVQVAARIGMLLTDKGQTRAGYYRRDGTKAPGVQEAWETWQQHWDAANDATGSTELGKPCGYRHIAELDEQQRGDPHEEVPGSNGPIEQHSTDDAGSGGIGRILPRHNQAVVANRPFSGPCSCWKPQAPLVPCRGLVLEGEPTEGAMKHKMLHWPIRPIADYAPDGINTDRASGLRKLLAQRRIAPTRRSVRRWLTPHLVAHLLIDTP